MAGQRLFLHVGPHKTGTSSFQSALAARSEPLHQDGLAVWRDGKGRTNAGALANLVTRPELQTAPRLQGRTRKADDDRRARARQRLGRWAAKAGTPDLLISSEAFSHLRTRQEAAWLRELLPSTVTQVVPILVRRPEADWRASRRAQLEKRGVTGTLDALADDTLSCDGAWYYDWAALSAFWAETGSVVTLDYAACLAAEGSVLPALARAIDRPGCLDGLENTWLNPRQVI